MFDLYLCLVGKINAGIDFLEFKPSEIAAAVAIAVSGGANDIEKEKMEAYPQMNTLIGGEEGSDRVVGSIPNSPIGVLDVGCKSMSYKSDELTTVGSCANSSHNSPDNKRRKLDL
ncbi:hypothetical protein RJ641_028003 [Dillenia turbinata]|uniref:Uncharacterized protein n=1 Tax=Dillenia turbinata TaxID=194707 RepID=A0AAN8W758_9MAGN